MVCSAQHSEFQGRMEDKYDPELRPEDYQATFPMA